MIDHIQLLRNIGQFDNAKSKISFSPLSLIYGENGSGKTTIAAVLRSASINDPDLITERRRLGSENPPHIVIDQGDTKSIFQEGAWTNPLSNITIFDDEFVSANVCSGIEVQSTHRQGLHELILGVQGVALNVELLGHIQRNEEHIQTLRKLSYAIPKNIRDPYEVSEFCNLNEDDDIDNKIKKVERHLAAVRSADAIHQKPIFKEISLPDFDERELDAVLGRDLPDLEAKAVERMPTHINKLGHGGEEWISDGMPRIETVSEDVDGEICPFCAQNLEGTQLIERYRAYFSQAYKNLKKAIQEIDVSIRDTHGSDIPSSFERDIRTADKAREFWKDFAELPEIEIDTGEIARQWNAAREAVLSQLKAKAAAPLEKMALTPEALQAIQDYRALIDKVSTLSQSLIGANDQLDIVKNQAQGDDLDELENNLAKLKAQKTRFDPAIAPHCKAYLAEKEKKTATEELRDRARDKLDEYRQDVFLAYEKIINDYLRRIGASFLLGKFKHRNMRSGSLASYCVVINKQNVNITANEGPSFRNTLSAGDRNTLALAFFFASLEKDPDLANKIVAIDDPMTSLDEDRTHHTQKEILAMVQRVQQIIVLSHSKPFLCHLWEHARDTSKALRINRVEIGYEIAVWNVQNDRASEHDKRHKLIRGYLQAADPDSERDVASALRPTLEAFMRVAYPEHFPPGSTLGQFLKLCNLQVNTDNKILSEADIDELQDLREYANEFHHDAGPAWQTIAIKDSVLKEYAKRTLLFTSRR